MTAIESQVRLAAAEAAVNEFHEDWKGKYALHGEVCASLAHTLAILEVLGFEFVRDGGDAGCRTTTIVNHDVGIYAQFTIDRAGGDGPRATAWAHLENLAEVKARLRKRASTEKAAATRAENSELQATREYAATLETRLEEAQRAALCILCHSGPITWPGRLCDACHARQAPAVPAAKKNDNPDCFQLIELD